LNLLEDQGIGAQEIGRLRQMLDQKDTDLTETDLTEKDRSDAK